MQRSLFGLSIFSERFFHRNAMPLVMCAASSSGCRRVSAGPPLSVARLRPFSTGAADPLTSSSSATVLRKENAVSGPGVVINSVEPISMEEILKTNPFLDQTRESSGHVPHVGRAWRIDELRLKSFADLQRLWYILLKERNMLRSERAHGARASAESGKTHKLKRPQRMKKVRLSMARIKTVIHERSSVHKQLLEFQNKLDAEAAEREQR